MRFLFIEEEEPTTLKKEEEEEDDSRPAAEDEDTGAQVALIVKLQEVVITTGEENEDILIDLFSIFPKICAIDVIIMNISKLVLPLVKKERGVGTVKLLKHKVTGKVRLVMRQNKTLKICANHLVLPTMSVQEHQGNDKSCVWHAADFSDGELKEETFCIRFASVENLMRAVPDEHKKFLADLVRVHEEDNVSIETGEGLKNCKLIVVHAGLEKGKGVEEQLKYLKAKDTRISKVEPLSGRKTFGTFQRGEGETATRCALQALFWSINPEGIARLWTGLGPNIARNAII
ncbi:hypothetical protein ACS0TY_018594 [Phlomoides rotata]